MRPARDDKRWRSIENFRVNDGDRYYGKDDSGDVWTVTKNGRKWIAEELTNPVPIPAGMLSFSNHRNAFSTRIVDLIPITYETA